MSLKIVEKEIMEQMRTNTGQHVAALSEKQPVMLIFLRHFGCTFCRAALAEISKKKSELEANGTHIVFVHMSTDDAADKYFKRYGLNDPIHISDPGCDFYQQFGLVKGNFNQLFGLSTWIRGVNEGVVKGHGIGKQLGDAFQMPGIFLIHHGKIKDQYIHRLASDKPDYIKLTECCAI